MGLIKYDCDFIECIYDVVTPQMREEVTMSSVINGTRTCDKVYVIACRDDYKVGL